MGKSASSYEYLKDGLKKGRLQPGRHLSPAELVKQFRISATPIHDALLRLAEEGYLTWTASRGFFVKPFLIQEQRDLFQLLQLGPLACLDLDGADFRVRYHDRIVALVHELPSLERGDQSVAADVVGGRIEELYIAAAEATGNQVLMSMIVAQIDRTYLVRRLHLADLGHRTAIAASLNRRAQAILSEDLVGAFEIARAGLVTLSERLPALVALANSQALQSRGP
jgi:DNA-binding GntR family transcriptional regulator